MDTILAIVQRGNLVQKTSALIIKSNYLTKSNYFDIYTSYPELLWEPILNPHKNEDLNEGIPPAQETIPGSFSELEDIVTLQEAASELDNNCTPLLEPIPDPFEVPRDILPIQDTASEAIDPQKLKIHLVLKLEK